MLQAASLTLCGAQRQAEGTNRHRQGASKMLIRIRCSRCRQTFTAVRELLDHIAAHDLAGNDANDPAELPQLALPPSVTQLAPPSQRGYREPIPRPRSAPKLAHQQRSNTHLDRKRANGLGSAARQPAATRA